MVRPYCTVIRQYLRQPINSKHDVAGRVSRAELHHYWAK
jgi:hypothetical protein